MLAENGVFLDEKPPLRQLDKSARVTTVESVDRERLRAVLSAAGAPDRDIDWLTASCPSMDDALTYKPTRDP